MTYIPPQLEDQPYWQPYLDLANDVKPFLNFPPTTTAQDGLLQSYIDAACDWAQDFLNQPIAPTTFFRRFNGYTGFGGSMIDLPYFPVLQVPTVVEYWGASGARTDNNCSITDGSTTVEDVNCQASDVGAWVLGPGFSATGQVVSVVPGVSFECSVPANETTTEAVVCVSRGHVLQLQTPQYQGDSYMFTVDAPRGIIFRSYLGLLQQPFFPGLKNIEVWWTAGRSPLPPRWRKGTLDLIKYWWETEQSQSPSFKPDGEYGEQHVPWSVLPGVPDRVASVFQSSYQIGFA